MNMENLTELQKQQIRRLGRRLPACKIAGYIMRYENLSLDDFENLPKEKVEIVCELLEQQTNISMNGNYWEEGFYEFLIEVHRNTKLAEGESIFDYMTGLFKDNKLCLFATVCNLYAYVQKLGIKDLINDAELYLSNIDFKGLFGRYAHKCEDLDRLLLQYVSDYIPELNEWVDLLVYTNDIYPCMPDMEWWRQEGKLQTSKSIFIAVYDYLNKYPNTIFKTFAEKIQSNVFPALYSWLFDDMRKHPWGYSDSQIRALEEGAGYDYCVDNILCKENFSPLEFFLYFKLKVSKEDLVRSGILTNTEAQNVQDAEEPEPVFESFPNIYKGGIDVLLFGIPFPFKYALVNSFMYQMCKDESAIEYNSEQQDKQERYIQYIKDCIEYNKCPYGLFPATQCVRLKQNSVNLNIINGEIIPYAITIENYWNNDIWGNLVQALLYLHNNNPKILCIAVDMDEESTKRYGPLNKHLTIYQRRYIDKVFDSLLNLEDIDGIDSSRKKPIKKLVTDVVILLTVSEDVSERDIIEEFAQKYRRLVSRLMSVCKSYRYNRANDYTPYILTYKVGQKIIGGFRYNFSDVEKFNSLLGELADNISRPWYKRIFKVFGK